MFNQFSGNLPADLGNLAQLETLILRSCNINDTLPPLLVNLTKCRIIDLSYNKLRGNISTNFEELTRSASYIYFTQNHFTGPMPRWIEKAKSIDLSYNNFSDENREQQSCQDSNANLFASFARNNTGPISCVRRTGCTQTVNSLHINCGGHELTVGGKTYEADSDNVRSAMYKEDTSSISVWTVVAIVAATIIIVILIVGTLWWRVCQKKKNSLAKVLQNEEAKNADLEEQHNMV
ncbi:LRR receptor serine/threonine-protein kinase [Spatholobus suberectus]|nr:LRR receptor serine/threonine-protein kinase [Spatholobus suberectus]